ncbi:phage antirepressor KilAC domain-containing protein [Dermabacteraceae bacterium P13115]
MTATNLKAFTNNAFGTTHTVKTDDKILFCGHDVATALGYTNTSKALHDHCKSVPFRYVLSTGGSTQEAHFISECDLYRLISSSNLPAAQAFESWCFDKVLPTIYHRDIYVIDELLQSDEFLKQTIAKLRSERRKRFATEQALAKAQPKVSYYDLVLHSPSLITITEIAKDYGLSARKLNAILHEAGVQFKQSGRWFLYADHANQSYTQSKTHKYSGDKTRTHMYWTQKGRLFIYNLLKQQLGLLPVIEQTDEGSA